MENTSDKPLQIRLIGTHALAMALAAFLTLAFAGCGSESRATSVTPEVAAGSHESLPSVETNDIDLDVDEMEDAGVASTETEEAEMEPAPVPSIPAPEAAAGDIDVRRIIPTTGIADREPVEERESFGIDELRDNGRVYAFFDVRNESDVDAHLNVVFISPSGRGHGQVELTIPAGARRWRTWAYTRAMATGTWDIELRAADGTVVAETRFEVERF